jgi:hypothetical protein
MAFAVASSLKVPANAEDPQGWRTYRDGPDTAQYGLVWPNEWPNDKITRVTTRTHEAPGTIVIAAADGGSAARRIIASRRARMPWPPARSQVSSLHRHPLARGGE